MKFIHVHIECHCDEAELRVGGPLPLLDGEPAFRQEPTTFRRAETGLCSLFSASAGCAGHCADG